MYQEQPYQNPYVGSISDLILRPADARAVAIRRAAQAQARASEQSGQIWGQTAGNLGQIAAGTVQAVTQQRQQTAQDQAFLKLMGSGQPIDPRQVLQIYGPEKGMTIAKGLQAFAELQSKQVTDARDTAGRLAIGLKQLSPTAREQLWPRVREAAIAGGLGGPAEIPDVLTPEFLDSIIGWASGKEPTPVTPKTRQVTVTNPDGSTTTKIVEDTPGQEFAGAAPPPKTYPVTVTGPDGGPITKLVTEEELRKGVPAYRAPTAPKSEPAKFWVVRDGQAVRVSEDEYRPGDLPSNTREQGRPVTAGDAGKIADFDTSLDDLAVLNTTLTSATGATGTSAAIGAGMPAWATDLLGWGADAKKRQGVIDRVKQVIGKTLEGGVLRKEDEYKYEKILPTIKDTAVVAAAKLAGLEKAIRLRRDTTIDALEDANYDVAKFRQRKPHGVTTIRARDPQGNLHEAAAGTALPAGWVLEP